MTKGGVGETLAQTGNVIRTTDGRAQCRTNLPPVTVDVTAYTRIGIDIGDRLKPAALTDCGHGGVSAIQHPELHMLIRLDLINDFGT